MLCFGEENPTAGELPVEWATWSDGAGDRPTTTVDEDWGKVELYSPEEGRSRVYDFQNADAKTLALTRNLYGTGFGTGATLQIRGQAGIFTQDAALPGWENYVGPVSRAWRYIQIREVRT